MTIPLIANSHPCPTGGLIVMTMLMVVYVLSPLPSTIDGVRTLDILLHRSRFATSFPSISKDPRVAICFTGGARAFELTGTSIRKNVLEVYKNADVFLHAPLDKDSYKFILLNSNTTKFVASRIFKQEKIEETRLYKDLLAPQGSANGIQGLLQYFNLVEGCWNMITKYETQNNFRYDWIIRTRVDSFWSSPLAPITNFSKDSYMVPYGSDYFGLNDRFGSGNRNTSKIAFSRLNMLQEIYNRTGRRINSETAYRTQFEIGNVTLERRLIPFCVVSKKSFGWPLSIHALPVASMFSKGPLNGAYCRPCTPAAIGFEAVKMHEKMEKKYGWIGPIHQINLQLCNPSAGWEHGWEELFDDFVGPVAAGMRNLLSKFSLDECRLKVEKWRNIWHVWDGVSPNAICLEHFNSTEH